MSDKIIVMTIVLSVLFLFFLGYVVDTIKNYLTEKRRDEASDRMFADDAKRRYDHLNANKKH